ncbi:MAG: MogA/MoaB family molybdenum cofactor biosynthesis protein [Candidatus Hydrothermarchaeales archaeon]
MISETSEKHKAMAPKSVRAAVLTVSDSKFDYLWSQNKGLDETDDVSGKYLIDSLKKAGHEVVFYIIVPDHEGVILEMIDHIVATYSPDVMITTGGTGVSERDVTVEAVRSVFEKELEGFGEIFRSKSYERLGEIALLSRAVAGVYADTLIFALPGSPDAVETGVNILLKELGHLVKHVRE